MIVSNLAGRFVLGKSVLRASITTGFCSESSLPPLVDVKLNEQHGFAVVSMQKPPVNSLNIQMIKALSTSLTDLEKEKCRGFILTSVQAIPGIFSAGLDIHEMYQTSEERLRTLWSSFQSLWLQLYGSKMASVALINGTHGFMLYISYPTDDHIGHSIAGGCMLALSCDSRLTLNGKFKIGLNETKLGIVAPSWLTETLINTIGFRTADRALQLGTLFSVEEALKIGLVDRVISHMEAGSAIAESELKEFLQIPGTARYLSKKRVREDTILNFFSNREADVNGFVSFAMTAPVQAGLGKYLENLAKKN